MGGELVAVMTALILLYSVLGKRLSDWNISAPMAAVVLGGVVAAIGGAFDLDLGWVHRLAEITLVLVLFHDASTVRLAQLRNDYKVALRLLAIGFPIALIATAAAAWLLLPALGLAGAVLVSAAITPTDAGLGAATVLNPVVPLRVRRALNVESGLNDGLATPIVLVSLASLAQQVDKEPPSLLQVGLIPVGLALVLAIVASVVAAWLVDVSRRRDWSTPPGREIALLMVPLLLLGLADLTGANAFIAAFVGGLVFGSAATTVAVEPSSAHLVETAADLLGLIVWFVGGALALDVVTSGLRWQWVVLAVGALTVLRVVPVWLALLGSRFWWPTIGFLGWFGPRGLASIVFAILAVEELGETDPVVGDVVGVIAVTVLISVFAHGLTAGPLSDRYGRWAARVHPPIEREPSVEPMTGRGQLVTGRRPDATTVA